MISNKKAYLPKPFGPIIYHSKNRKLINVVIVCGAAQTSCFSNVLFPFIQYSARPGSSRLLLTAVFFLPHELVRQSFIIICILNDYIFSTSVGLSLNSMNLK